jgi:hypothetical protein
MSLQWWEKKTRGSFKMEFKKKGWLVIEYSSLAEFTNRLRRDKATKTLRKESNDTEYDRLGWAKSTDLEDALDQCKTGNAEIMEGLKEAVKLEVDNLAKELMSEPEGYVNDVHGLFFDIAKVIEGEPEAWLREPWDKQKKPRISVPIRGNYGGSFSSDNAIANASKVIALIKALEDTGIEVELKMVFASTNVSSKAVNGNRNAAISVTIKNYDESFNWKKVSSMLHPSFFRRLIFRERELLFPDTLSSGYGNSPRADDFGKEIEGGENWLMISDAESIEKFKVATLGMLTEGA